MFYCILMLNKRDVIIRHCRLALSKQSLKIPKGGYQNPYIKEEQTTQWPKEKVQKDKQRSTKHTHKAKDQVTRAPLKTGSELSALSTVMLE